MAGSRTCDFYRMDTETIEHLFWTCQVVQNFWTQIRNFMIRQNMVVHLNFKTVSFGTDTIYENAPINFLILTATYCIVKCKYNEQAPDINLFFIIPNKGKRLGDHCFKQG